MVFTKELINLDEDKSIVTHWIALYVNGGVSYFDGFGVEYTPKLIKKFIDKKISQQIFIE